LLHYIGFRVHCSKTWLKIVSVILTFVETLFFFFQLLRSVSGILWFLALGAELCYGVEELWFGSVAHHQFTSTRNCTFMIVPANGIFVSCYYVIEEVEITRHGVDLKRIQNFVGRSESKIH
jgi:hypothetical protein